MNNEEYKSPEEKIRELMDGVTDKKSDDYRQVEEILKKKNILDKKIQDNPDATVLKVLNSQYETLTMDEIIKASLSFQRIPGSAESGEEFVEFLAKPTFNKLVYLEIISQSKNSDYSKENIEWAKGEHEALKYEILSGCLELQEKLTSLEMKNYIFQRTLQTFEGQLHRALYPRELLNDEAVEKGYREIAIDSLFGTKEKELEKFQLLYNYLKMNGELHKFLQKDDLTVDEKKTYVHIALTRSRGYGDEFADKIDYYRGKHSRNSKILDKCIANSAIIALIEKEVPFDTVVMCDDLLGKTKINEIDLMIKLYGEVQSTIIKEHIRKQVDTSYSQDQKLRFYKEVIQEKLLKENHQELGKEVNQSFNKVSDSSAISSETFNQFEKIYVVIHSNESKVRYDYIESKELLADLGKNVLGQKSWEKFDTILLLKQELSDEQVKETIRLPEMMQKSFEEITNQRIENGLRAIGVTGIVRSGQTKPEEIANTMLQLKTHFSDWDDGLERQVKTYLTAHLSRDEQEQAVKIFNEKQVIQEVVSILPNGKERWQKLLDSSAHADIENKVEEAKKVLVKEKVDYVFPFAAKIIELELKKRKIDYISQKGSQDFLELLNNPKKGQSLVLSIQEKLQNKQFQPDESQVAAWINLYVKTDAVERRSQKQAIVKKIEKVLAKKTNEKNTAASQLNKDLTKARYKIESNMDTELHNVTPRYSFEPHIEKKFTERIYKDKDILRWTTQNPALKKVFYECQKRVPFGEVITSNQLYLVEDSEMRKRMKPNIHDWWSGRMESFEKILDMHVDKKNQLISKLNRRIADLGAIDNKIGAEVVWSLVVDTAGPPINLASQNRHFFDSRDSDFHENTRKVEDVVNSYEEVKKYIETQEVEKKQKADLLPVKETTKSISMQTIAESLKKTSGAPKTAVEASPTTDFASLKKQALKEVPQAGSSGLNRETKESLVQMREFTEVKKSAIEKEKQNKENTWSWKDRIASFIRGRAN
jgi:hypothetical protein